MAKRQPKTGTPKTSVVSVRLQPEQRQKLEETAIAAGMSLSAFTAKTLSAAIDGREQPAVADSAEANGAATPTQEHPPPTATRGAETATMAVSLSDPMALAELRRIGVNINQIAHTVNIGLSPDLRASALAFAQLFALLSNSEAFQQYLAAMKKGAPRRDPPHPPPRNELQDSRPLHPARPPPIPPTERVVERAGPESRPPPPRPQPLRQQPRPEERRDANKPKSFLDRLFKS